MQRVLVSLGVMLQPLAGVLAVAILVEPGGLVHVVLTKVHPGIKVNKHYCLCHKPYQCYNCFS